MLRKLEAVDLDGVTPAPLADGKDDDGLAAPILEWGDPRTLYVDDTYQRGVGGKGLALIKRVAKGGWSWRKFKPPVVTEVEVPGVDAEYGATVTRLVAIDGQHTAIMAVSRGLTSIPWMRVQTGGVGAQAEAFIGQNKDRTAISAMHEYTAGLAAGHEWALDVQNVLARAGAKLIMWNKPAFEVGETLALGTIKVLINRRNVPNATKVVRVCVMAGLAPISADHLKAVDQLLFEGELKGLVREDKLVQLLSGPLGVRLVSEGEAFAATHRVPKWKGLTSVLYQNRGRAI